MVAVSVVIALLVVPPAIGRLWLFTTDEARFETILDLLRGPRGIVWVIAVSIIQVVAGLSVSQWIARREAARITRPMTELTAQAERLGAGESRIGRVESGIDEIDRVSDVLSHSAVNITRQLAQQRDFAADASHQLRTPLTALLMRLDEIAATDDIEAAREEAGIAIDQVERLTKVVDDLMARSRAHADDQRHVSLDSVLAALQREWQPAFASARRSVRVHGERGLYVQATRSAVSQIISTLLENSLQHGRGTVDVHARRSGPSVVLEMSDQGVGVPLDIAARFYKFITAVLIFGVVVWVLSRF